MVWDVPEIVPGVPEVSSDIPQVVPAMSQAVGDVPEMNREIPKVIRGAVAEMLPKDGLGAGFSVFPASCR